VIEQPHFDAYSIPARIAAVLGVSVLVAMAIASVYFMH
jgi:hypothetical protein